MEEKEITSVSEEKSAVSEKIKSYFKNLLDFSQYDIKTILYILLFIALIIASLVLLYFIYFVDNTILYRFVIGFFVNPVYNLGILGILLFVLIMALQGLLVPLPSEIVLLATGMIWGWFYGGIMGIVGSMTAGLLCYYISKRGGRPLAEKFVGEKAIEIADKFIKKHGMKAIIITRFIPVIPFDVISYTAGIVDIDVKKYSIGTLIGSIFRAFFYATLGSLLFMGYSLTLPLDFDLLPLNVILAQSNYFNNILLIILASLAIMFFIYYLLIKKLGKRDKEN
ncbi:MAG: VTT domain-containing protein [Candidatus Lokiarchaeota archaeon]|nr:VTT domain-containing protein [Candidatus Lokiarchaeota archaeon]